MRGWRFISRRNAAGALLVGTPVVKTTVFFRALLGLTGLAETSKARADAEDGSEILVNLISTDPDVIRAFVRKYSLEVVRATLPQRPGDPTVALVLMKSSVLRKAANAAGLKVELVATPPGPDAVPKVGRGNRFRDPQVLPEGRGVLVKKTP